MVVKINKKNKDIEFIGAVYVEVAKEKIHIDTGVSWIIYDIKDVYGLCVNGEEIIIGGVVYV